MGSPVSPVVANIFMEHLEDIAAQQPPSPVRFWRTYVDDTFYFLQTSSVDGVLNHLNSISPSITYLHRGTRAGRKAFFPRHLSYKSNGWDPEGECLPQTHTDRYLPFESHHPFHMKREVVQSIVRRAEEISTDDSLLKKEIKHLRTVLTENGYPSNLVTPTHQQGTKKDNDEEDEEDNRSPPLLSLT